MNRAKMMPPQDGCKLTTSLFIVLAKINGGCRPLTHIYLNVPLPFPLAQLLPPALYQEALSCHAAGNEILRHFWASTGADKEAKHTRMVESLNKIRDDNIKSLMIQASSLGANCHDAMKMVKMTYTHLILLFAHHYSYRPRNIDLMSFVILDAEANAGCHPKGPQACRDSPSKAIGKKAACLKKSWDPRCSSSLR